MADSLAIRGMHLLLAAPHEGIGRRHARRQRTAGGCRCVLLKMKKKPLGVWCCCVAAAAVRVICRNIRIAVAVTVVAAVCVVVLRFIVS